MILFYVRKNFYRSKNHLTKINVIYIFKRPVMSAIKKTVKKTYQQGSFLYNKKNIHYTINHPDPNPPNTQLAFSNNPLIDKKAMRHLECHRQQCDDSTCETRDCPSVCGNPMNRKAVGHATYGQSPNTDKTKVTVVVSSTDLDCNNKSQKMVIYKKAHEVNSTPEHVNGTAKLQADSTMRQIISQNEDKS